ncbi:MAG TPA: DUF885 domain-containing protein [Candidatus Acidoferrum sp.]|nr:DUF885 domain-containing protein [Candidatus Acidoferrum sp.]
MNRSVLAKVGAVVCAVVLWPLLTIGQGASHTAANEEVRRFRVFLSEDWKQWMQEYPEYATSVGFPGQNRRWTDDSQAGRETRIKHMRESTVAVKQFHRELLPPNEQLNYDLYVKRLQNSEEGLQYGGAPWGGGGNIWIPITQMDGVQQGPADVLAMMPRQTVSEYEDIMARLEALPVLVDQNMYLMKEGLEKGYSPPKITMRDVPKQVEDLIPPDPMKSALLEPFTKFPASMGEADRVRLTERARQVYTSADAPAYKKLHEYLVSTYIPACRETIAARDLPNGVAAYAYRVRWYTTTNLTPAQIHEIGLTEVKRIRAEMDKVIASTGFKGSFKEFTEFLRTDPQFFYDKPEDLVNGYRALTKEIDPQLAHEFGKLPRLTYGVVEIPAFTAPSQTTAYYQAGSPEAGRPGSYFVNTYNLMARPKWEMEALSLHESVPGHHLQIALAQEQEGVPEFRKHSGYTAFEEGWGLYAESLGPELGMYKDPYSKFGQLTYEMWRAVRLVVDTGMHMMGWSRQQAIDFFRENTSKTDQDITVEVDRYIVWPGQALAYKIGQMKIRELRTEAEKELRSKFNVRTFHDAVLEQGAVPLDLLQAHVEEWIAKETKRVGQ